MGYDVYRVSGYYDPVLVESCATRDWAVTRAEDYSKQVEELFAVIGRKDRSATTTEGAAYKGRFRWRAPCPDCKGECVSFTVVCQRCKGAAYAYA